MQVPVKYYNEKDHDRYRALVITRPQADKIINASPVVVYLPVLFHTHYRGEVVLCSDGETVALADLKDSTPREGGWLLHLRNIRRIVEMPVKGGRGLFTLVVPKGDLTPYPQHIILERKDYAK